jgi:hypothetical protein
VAGIHYRYPGPVRVGQAHVALLQRLGFALDDPRLTRAGHVIEAASEMSWSRVGAGTAPLTRQQVTARAAGAVTTLASELISREGNLRLTAVAPVIASLPDPDATWIAVLTLLAELAAAGAVPPVTSLTQFRFADDGTPQHVILPPEAEALINRRPPAAPWLGASLARPGHPAWLLDEAVVPAALRHPAEGS